jgi:hypothetical protein
MDRDVIAHSGQALRLFDDGVRVFVTQKYEGDFCHVGNELPYFRPIVYVDKGEQALNKPTFFAFLKGI